MSFDPTIFDIVSELHSVATYFNTHGYTDLYAEFIPVFRLIGVGNYETALFKIAMFNKDLTLLTSAQYIMSYHRAVEKLKNIVELN